MVSLDMEAIYKIAINLGNLQKIALASFVLISVTLIAYWKFHTIIYPQNLPRLGAQDGLSWADMRKKFQTDCTAVYEEAYEKVIVNVIRPSMVELQTLICQTVL